MFKPITGSGVWGAILGVLAVSAVLFFCLTLVPPRARKPLIAGVTFLAGLFYAAEFFWPVHQLEDGSKGNWLTPWQEPITDITTVLEAFALGIGIYSLLGVHLRSLARRRTGWGFSVVLIGAMLAILIPGIANIYHPNRYNDAVYKIFYDGAYNNLNATTYSVVAFYIVSAAYRAFRIRSTEATILLVSAAIIMIGKIALGQALTSWIPNEGFSANFRVENMSSWVLTKVNSPAIFAIDLGLGVGSLATALRLWLSLEKGSYFEEEL